MSPDIKIPNNAEIDKALKEFEMQKYGTSQTSQTPVITADKSIPQTSPIPQSPIIPKPPIIVPKDTPQGLDDLGIHFEEDELRQVDPSLIDDTPRMMKWVIKYSGGMIKDRKQASYILFGIVLLNVVITFFLLFGNVFSGSPKLPPSSIPRDGLNQMPINPIVQ